MTLSVKQGTFTKDTSTSVPVSQDITGLGFTPSCIWMWTEGSTGTSYEDHNVMSYGFSDGSANGCIANAVKRVVSGTSSTGGSIRDDSCVCILDAAGTPTNVLARGKVTGFSSGTVSFQWDANTAVASIVHYMAIGGTDITNVKVLSTTTGTTSIGNKGYTGVGFQPDFAQVINGSVSQTTINATSNAWIFATGTAKSTTERWVVGVSSENGVASSTDCYSYIEITKFIDSWSPATGTQDAVADFVSFGADGLTVNYTDAPGSASQCMVFLCIKGGLWDVNTTQASSGATQNVSITTLRTPKVVQLFNVGHGSGDGSSSGTAGEAWSTLIIGGSDGTTNGLVWSGDTDASATGTTTRVTKTNKCTGVYTENATAASSTINLEGSVTDMTTSGRFQLTWSTIASGWYFHYWVLSEQTPYTKLYLHATTTGIPSGTLPSAEQSTKTVTANCNFEGSQTTNRLMNTNIGASQTSLALATPASSSASTFYVSRWVSPLIYQTSVPASTWIYNFATKQSSTSANFPVTSNNKAVWVNCYVWKPSDGTKYGTILDGNTAATVSEGAANTELCKQADFTGAAVSSLTSGDACIVLEAWFAITQGSATSYTDTYYYDGTTEGVSAATVSNHASYITIVQNTLNFTPESTQVNQTYTHIYKIVGRSAQTYSHKYKIVGRANQTYTQIYNIKSLINQTFTHKYKLIGRAAQVYAHIYKIVGRSAQTFTQKYKIRQLTNQTYTQKYKIRSLISQTFSHKYKIRQLTSQTFSHKYNIKSLVSQQFTHIYNILAALIQVNQTFSHVYNIRQLTNQTYSHKYNILVLVNATKTFKYKIIGRALQTFSHKYNIKQLVNQQYIHKYKIIGRALQTFSHKYNIAELVNQTFSHKYNLRALISQSFSHKYNILELVNQTFVHKYNILVLVNATKIFKYKIIGRANQTYSHIYNIKSLVNQSYSHKYKIVGRAFQSFSHIYNIKQFVNQTYSHKYNIRQLVNQSYTFKYKLAGIVSQTFTHIYNIISVQLVAYRVFTHVYKITGRVNNTYGHRYNIKQLVANQFTQKYSIRQLANQVYAFKYKIIGRAAQTYTHVYNIKELVSQQYSHKYKIIGRAVQTYIQKYNIRQLINTTKIHKYNIKQLVNQTYIHKYKLRMLVSQEFTHIYNIIQIALAQVSQTFTHKYAIRQLAVQSFSHKYNIRKLVSKTYNHKYNILTSINKIFTQKYRILSLVSTTKTFKYGIKTKVHQVFKHIYQIHIIPVKKQLWEIEYNLKPEGVSKPNRAFERESESYFRKQFNRLLGRKYGFGRGSSQSG